MVTVSYLIIGGGGGGTQYGGGGAGAMISGSDAIVAGSFAVVVGTGGTGRATGTNGDNGVDSSFNAHTATGGGGGGNYDGTNGHVGANGGSGGGGSGDSTAPTHAGGTGTTGGNNGGSGTSNGSTFNNGGGGGGAGAVGGNGSAGGAGNGGAGSSSSISGGALSYAGGGGGGAFGVSAGTASNGGGAGSTGNGTSGAANTGGGGGGAGTASTGGNGGAGIVVISYPVGSFTATGGVITIVGGNTIHTFNASGTWAIVAAASDTPVMGKSMRPFRNTRAGILSTAALPDVPSLGYPTNGLQTVSTTPTLRWISHGASSFDIAFGTSPSPPTILTNQWPASYSPTLVAGTTYYWQITAHSAIGTAVGPIWSFVAQPAPDPIDATHPCLNQPPLTYIVDRTQLRNSIKVTGGVVAQTTADAGPSTTIIPVVSSLLLSPVGGQLTIPSPRQVFNYTGFGLGYTPAFDTWVSRAGLVGIAPQSILWVAELGLFVGLSNGAAFTSSDGISWTIYGMAGSNWGNIVWSPTLKLLVSTSTTDGHPYTSPDGSTWTQRAIGETNAWISTTWSPQLNLFVTTATTGTHRVATSPDGITWTLQNAVSADQWSSVVWADTLGLFVAQSFNGSSFIIMTSPDGASWTGRASTFPTNGNGLAWSNPLKLLVSVGSSGSIYTSPDGTVWTFRTAPSTNQWSSVIWVSEMAVFMAVSANATGSAQQIMTSPDGITWTGHNCITGTWSSLAWSAPLLLMVAIGIGATAHEMTNLASSFPIMTGVSGIKSVIPSGSSLNIYALRDSVAGQLAAALVEGGDGVHEWPLSDSGLLTVAQVNNAGDAENDLFAFPILGVDYHTRDPKSATGQLVHIDRPDLGILGDFLIQTVSVSNVSTEQGAYPVYHVKASSVKFTFLDAIRQFLLPG